jgi:hypothetical protein
MIGTGIRTRRACDIAFSASRRSAARRPHRKGWANTLPEKFCATQSDIPGRFGSVATRPAGVACDRMSALHQRRPDCRVNAKALLDQLLGTGERRGRPSRSITSENLAMTVDPLYLHHTCSGCNPGKCPDTGKMVFVSRTGSRDIAHDSCLCIVD